MTKRRVYVASSWRNEQQQAVVARLRDEGHEVYDFKNPGEGVTGFTWKKILAERPPWSAEKTREVLAHPTADEDFNTDFDAMKWADTIVMVQPCGRSAALEVGWGAGAGKRTIALLADGQEPELMLRCCDHLAVSLDEVVTLLAQPEEGLLDNNRESWIAEIAKLSPDELLRFAQSTARENLRLRKIMRTPATAAVKRGAMVEFLASERGALSVAVACFGDELALARSFKQAIAECFGGNVDFGEFRLLGSPGDGHLPDVP